jgi:hypothetical protein
MSAFGHHLRYLTHQNKRYCSKECQQQDWSDHKRYCQKESAPGKLTLHSKSSSNDRCVEITPVSDREFARERAEFEVRMNVQSLCERIQKNPALQTKQDLMFQVDFTTLDRDISIGVAPGTRAKPDRVAAIYAKVQQGREEIRSLGLVTSWTEMQTSARQGSIFFPERFQNVARNYKK